VKLHTSTMQLDGPYVGYVKSYNPLKGGLGFLECLETFAHYGKDILIPKSSLPRLHDSLQKGTQYLFNVAQGKTGPIAVNMLQQSATHIGVVKSYNSARGYGFVSCAATFDIYDKDIRFQREEFEKVDALAVGQEVHFKVTAGQKGPLAVGLRLRGALAPAAAVAAKCSIAQGSTWKPTLRHTSKEAEVVGNATNDVPGITISCLPSEDVATQCAVTCSDEQDRWEPTLSKLGPAAHNAKATLECEVAIVGEETKHSSGDVVELPHQLLMSRSNSESSLKHDGEESQASVLDVDPFVPQHCLQSWEYPLSKNEKRLLYARLCDQERAAAVHQYQHLRQRTEYFRLSAAHESQHSSDESEACEDEEGAKLQAKQRELQRQLKDVRKERRRLSLARP